MICLFKIFFVKPANNLYLETLIKNDREKSQSVLYIREKQDFHFIGENLEY